MTDRERSKKFGFVSKDMPISSKLELYERRIKRWFDISGDAQDTG